ncbi:MAG TPA: hypothetical protein VGI43_10180 [Mucilaginibacter sp.]
MKAKNLPAGKFILLLSAMFFVGPSVGQDHRMSDNFPLSNILGIDTVRFDFEDASAGRVSFIRG